MKRIIIGTVIATLIFFAYQTAMWMGGIHGDFAKYTPENENIISFLDKHLDDGMYWMPMVDPTVSDKQKAEEELYAKNIGKPWAMIFYHKSMPDYNSSYILMGVFYTLIACLITVIVLYYGNFNTFGKRFMVAMAFAIFALSQGVLDDMNWWGFPWSFVKPQVVDLTLGWAICSLWMAWYVKKAQ